jgi:uncharacterized protein YjdB
MRKVFLFIVTGFAYAISITSCSKDEGVSLTGITLEPSSLSLFVTGQRQVKATPVPAEATGVVFAWSSADESVATVSQSGVVVGKKIGSTSITVSSGNVKATLPVEVVVESVSIGAIHVNRTKVIKAIDDTALIVATPLPANATNVSFVWESADESIAKVDQNGIITIIGIGSTIVTVSSGTVIAEIEVEGTIKSIIVTDSDGRTGGTYPVGYALKLFTTFDPVDADVTPEWKTSNERVAIVGEDGLVTILKTGIATITASVGNYKNTYTVSTTSPFEDVSGYWLFNDATNLGKAVIGDDLVINNAVVSAVAGPSSSNGAVRGGWEERGVGDNNVENIRWDHSMKGDVDHNTKLRNYTVMMDIKVPYQDPSGTVRQVWNPLSSWELGRRAALYLLWADFGAGSEQSFGLAASLTGELEYLLQDTTYLTMNPTTIKGKEKWIRFVYVFKYAGDNTRTKCELYVDGKPAIDPLASYTDDSNWKDCEIVIGKPVYFMTGVKSDKAYKGQYDLSTLAVWNRFLSADEVAVLGGIAE